MKCELCGMIFNGEWQLNDFFNFSVRQQSMICGTCQDGFQRIMPNTGCFGCQSETNEKYCSDCTWWLRLGYPNINNQALFKYNNQMQSYFKAYKFQGGYHLRNIFKYELQQRLFKVNVDKIVPIPITDDTLCHRGYNQVVGWLEGLTFEPLLRCRETKKMTQSHKTRQARLLTNQPFSIASSTEDISEKSICIVDDIYTTGQTLRHAAQCLVAAGATKIISLTLAR